MFETNMIHQLDIKIPVDDALLEGNLRMPDNPKGLILFIHGSGSSRFSPRNKYVAELLNQAGLATLLFDLLTHQENEIDSITREYRFDIELLSRRSSAAIKYVKQQQTLQHLPIGLFGASTGAAAALYSAYSQPENVNTVVSRGGRPDLAMPVLAEVKAPTLLIVGGQDIEVIRLNESAKKAMKTDCELTIIPGATHLFEEPGTLDQAANAAKDWFLEHL